MESEYLVTKIDKSTIVEFRLPSLMDAQVLESIGERLYKLVDLEDNRLLILDFSLVEYISSQAIGIVIKLHKKLEALRHSKLILCGVSAKLMELLRITRLDRVLTLKPSQKEAVAAMALV